jgi:hypothetical protein
VNASPIVPVVVTGELETVKPVGAVNPTDLTVPIFATVILFSLTLSAAVINPFAIVVTSFVPIKTFPLVPETVTGRVPRTLITVGKNELNAVVIVAVLATYALAVHLVLSEIT